MENKNFTEKHGRIEQIGQQEEVNENPYVFHWDCLRLKVLVFLRRYFGHSIEGRFQTIVELQEAMLHTLGVHYSKFHRTNAALVLT